MNEEITWLSGFGVVFTPWKLIGLAGSLMFVSRWVVQAIASRRAGKPVVPRVFWYLSIVGSLMALSYFVFGKNDAVGIIQNLFPALVAIYSLSLDIKHRGWHRDKGTH